MTSYKTRYHEITQNNMSYMDLYHSFTPPHDNTSPNLYVKETVATLVEYAKDKGPGVYSLEIERYPHIHMNVKMRELSYLASMVFAGVSHTTKA